MNRLLVAVYSACAIAIAPTVAFAEDAIVTPPPVISVPGNTFTTPPQYGDAGNGMVVELPRFNPDGSAYRHGVDPLPITPNPRSLSELGLDSSTKLLTINDDTIVPLARPMPTSFADSGAWPFGLDSNGRPVPAPLFNEDGSPYIHGVSPLPYIPQKLPEYLPLPPRFTASDFKKLTPDQISNMSTGDFSQLPTSLLKTITETQAMLFRGPQVATFSASDAFVLSPKAVSAIAPSEFKSIKTKSFAAFKPAVIDALTVEHFEALSPKHFAAMKPAQAAKIGANQVQGIDPADVSALSITVIAKLKPELLASMDEAQLEAFKSAQIKKFTRAQKKLLTTKQLEVLAD